jgi:multidrug efflux pump subunit AcrA (membrane-fusion protein)
MHTSPLRAAARPAAALVIAPLLLLSSCAPGKGGPGGPMGRGGMPPLPAEVAEVTRATVRDPFRALGSLEAVQEAVIVAEAAGRVTAIGFAEGGPVAEGAVLARLDDREEQAEVQRAEAQLTLSRSETRRVEELFARDLASPRERDQARAALAVAEA